MHKYIVHTYIHTCTHIHSSPLIPNSSTTPKKRAEKRAENEALITERDDEEDM
jgi:hypothetical protein